MGFCTPFCQATRYILFSCAASDRKGSGYKHVQMNGTAHDRRVVTKAENFIEKYCTHVRGSRTGEPLILAPWQHEIVTSLFGSVRANGDRQYKLVWIEAPRKSGKTTLAAALMLYMLLVDEEAGAEISSSSTTNASICFNIARSMIENNADMSAVCTVRNKCISYKNNHIRLAALTAAASGGLDLSMAVIDDVQNVIQRDLHETLKSAVAARRNPIIFPDYASFSACQSVVQMRNI